MQAVIDSPVDGAEEGHFNIAPADGAGAWAVWEWHHDKLIAPNAAGPAILNEAATATNPTLIPNRADPDTGIGWAAANELSFITGGVRHLSVSSSGVIGRTASIFCDNSAGPILSNSAATSTNPTLRPNRTDSDTGIGWVSADVLSIIAGGVQQIQIASSSVIFTPTIIGGSNAAGPAMLNEAATQTNPTLVPNRADPDTGIGWQAADAAGGVSAMSWTTTGIFPALTVTLQGPGGALCSNAAGPQLVNEAATKSNPTVLVNRAELDTGWGWASDELWAIGGGVSLGKFSSNDVEALEVYSYENDATAGPVFSLLRARSGSAGGGGAAGQDGDVLGRINFQGYNDNATPERISYGSIISTIVDASDGTEDGILRFMVPVAGDTNDKMQLFANANGATQLKLYSFANIANPALIQTHHARSGSVTSLGVVSGSAGVSGDIIGRWSVNGLNNAATPEDLTYAWIKAEADDVTDGSEDGRWHFQLLAAGLTSTQMQLGPDGMMLNNAANPVNSILDEDNMASDSDTALATQQSIKAYVDSQASGSIVSYATDDSTGSPTSMDFTGIPSGTLRIHVMFVGISTNGTSVPLLQLGDSGGIETTGYWTRTSSESGANVYSGSNQAGFGVGGTGAANTLYGEMTLSRATATGNIWVINGENAIGTSGGVTAKGSKTLTTELDRIRLTTVNGTDTYDAGTVYVRYES
jgi:hypothetical protein